LRIANKKDLKILTSISLSLPPLMELKNRAKEADRMRVSWMEKSPKGKEKNIP